MDKVMHDPLDNTNDDPSVPTELILGGHTLTSLTDAFGNFESGDGSQPRLRVLSGGRRS